MQFPFALNSTIGRTYNVNLNDTRRVKKALYETGYFSVPTYGLTDYPDEPMFQAIESFQSDHGLHRDGVMNPSGETAQTLGHHLLYRKNKKSTAKAKHPSATTTPDDCWTKKTPNTTNQPRRTDNEIACDATQPIIYQVAVHFGRALTAAYTWWQSMSASEKEVIRNKIKNRGAKANDNNLDECDHLHYNVDIPVCNSIKKKRGIQAAERCFASANRRYAACLQGTPASQLPPLDTWNN